MSLSAFNMLLTIAVFSRAIKNAPAVEANDDEPLTELASRIVTAAEDAANLTQDIVQVNKKTDADPVLARFEKDLRSFAGICLFLGHQLEDKTLESEFNERCWKCIRSVMQLWLRNTRINLNQL